MKTQMKETEASEVLNTHADNGQKYVAVDVSVLLSDYAKIRAIARERRKTPMRILEQLVCKGVRELSGALIVAILAFVVVNAGADSSGTHEMAAAIPSQADSGMLLSPSWFKDDGSFIRRREEKIAVLSPDRLRELQRLVAARNAYRADMAALERLSAEQSEAVRAMDARFAGEYGIRQDRRYSYDADKMTLFLVSSDPRHGGSEENPAMLPHRTFPTEEEATAFLALMKAKEEALTAIRVFDAALADRREKFRVTLAGMQAGFNLSLDRAYRLEPETRSVYAQFVAPPAPPAPTPEELAAQKAAKEEAERLAREEARKKAQELREEAKRLAEEKKKLAAEETEANREREEALRKVEKELAELDAKAAKEAKEKAEREAKAAKEKARAEAEAKARAEKEAREKARAEAKAAEKKARAEAEAKARAEKEAKEKAAKEARIAKAKAEQEAKAAREAAFAAEVKRLAEERRQALDAAKTKLEEAVRAEAKAKLILEDAEKTLDWARKNKKTSEEIANCKAAVSKAEKRVDEADDAVDAARKAVKAAEKTLSRIKDDAERKIKEMEKAR